MKLVIVLLRFDLVEAINLAQQNISLQTPQLFKMLFKKNFRVTTENIVLSGEWCEKDTKS